ncbi:MAG: hypothetical protein DIU68_011055 [Chloroflexota bacterium]|nr:MAG: hypothetical protein DIU68_15905 [Chloroflexota bacterium]
MQTPAGRPSALAKPTLDTKFHIDYSWWERNRQDLRVYLLSHLLPDLRERLSQSAESRVVDFIDPETGEVSRLDELQLAIQISARDPNFINPHTSLVDSIFRVFLANGNKPLTPRELEQATGRPASLILKTLSGARIYKGIRPYQPS